MKRKATERQNASASERNLVRRKRKLPAAMISYIKPRRKRRLLPIDISSRSSRGIRSEVKDSAAKSAETGKTGVVELTNRRTSASIKSRYRRLDQQRSQNRIRLSSEDDRARPSTRSQTVALMHQQLVIARMKSVDETEIPQHAADVSEPLSENYSSIAPKRTTSSHHGESRTTSVQQKLAEKRSLDRQLVLGVKKEAVEGDESERSMRRFIRRRKFPDVSGASRGDFILLNKVCGLRIVHLRISG